MYYGVFFILSYVGDKNILFVCRLYGFYFHSFNIWSNDRYYIRAKIILISSVSFYEVVISSPLGMNMVTCGVLIVERMINMCGMGLIYIAIYIRFKYYVY